MKADFWCNLRQKLTCTIPCEEHVKTAIVEGREGHNHRDRPNSIGYSSARFVIRGIRIFYLAEEIRRMDRWFERGGWMGVIGVLSTAFAMLRFAENDGSRGCKRGGRLLPQTMPTHREEQERDEWGTRAF